MNEALDGVKAVLNHYDLTPINIRQHGNVMEVATSRGTYALKPLSYKNEARFLEILPILHSQTLPILPLYLTKYGEPLARMNHECYYLTPWVEDLSRNDVRKWEILVDQMARLHRRTKNQPSANRKKDDPIQNSETQRAVLEKFAFQAEHQPYPSPFEQQLLVLFHRIMADAEQARGILEQQSRSEEAHSQEQSVVLCHGRPELNHLIFTERGSYFINFDHAYWGSPIYDLADILKSPQIPQEMPIRLYDQYQTVNPLTMFEKKYLLAELLKPTPFEQLMNKYREETMGSELLFIGELHDLCLKRQQLQMLFNHIEKELSDETNKPLDPSLEETDVKRNEQNENDNVESRRPENSTDHLENGEG